MSIGQIMEEYFMEVGFHREMMIHIPFEEWIEYSFLNHTEW
jgi:hypothetical protein